MNRKLFVVISKTLRGGNFLCLDTDTFEVLVLPEGRITVEHEPPPPAFLNAPAPWDAILKPIILERIQRQEDWQESVVRIAGHLWTCFGVADTDRDQRFPAREKDLIETLGREIDLEVWGFHHETKWSKIWKVLFNLPEVLKQPSEVQLRFIETLEDAFRQAANPEKEESTRDDELPKKESPVIDPADRLRTEQRFANARHDIMNLLGPIQVRLENARDRRTEGVDGADEIEASVNDVIDPTVTKALNRWKECGPMVGGENAKSFAEVITQLNTRPKPNSVEFRAWLNTLYDCMSKF